MSLPEDNSALKPHPERRLLYTSEPILARRRRLLREVRRMIAEDGIDKFSVRRLCLRADVAQRTLYNAFHSKDRVVALAIREAFDEFNRHIRYRTQENTLAGTLDRTIEVNRRNFRVRNYTKAVVSIYFDHSTPIDVWETLRDMSVNALCSWFQILNRRGELKPWVVVDHFATTMANLQYAVINDWCANRLSDDQYLPRMAQGMLLLLVGALQGRVRDEAEQFLIDLRRTGEVPKFPSAIWSPPYDPLVASGG